MKNLSMIDSPLPQGGGGGGGHVKLGQKGVFSNANLMWSSRKQYASSLSTVLIVKQDTFDSRMTAKHWYETIQVKPR